MNTKMLEWKEDDGVWNADAHGFSYEIRRPKDFDGYCLLRISWNKRQPIEQGDFVFIEAAKSECQSHHEAILAAVEENKKEAYSDGFDAGFKSARETFEKPKWIECDHGDIPKNISRYERRKIIVEGVHAIQITTYLPDAYMLIPPASMESEAK